MKIGIIFDMDGTLWDSAEGVAESWNEIIAEKKTNMPPLTKEDIMNVMGLTMTEIGDIIFKDIPAEERASLLGQCMDYENEYLSVHGGVLYPKLEETLAKLRETFPLYIVSNCQAGYIEAFLDHYGFHSYFLDHVCFGDNGLPKAKNIRLLARRNDLERYFYVGDIEADRIAAESGGAEFIHASYGFGTVSKKVPVLPAFSGLPELMDSLLHPE
jgi:phosphoglycolate phosphatase